MITKINEFKQILESNNIDLYDLDRKIESIKNSPLWNTIITELNNEDVDYMHWSDLKILLYYKEHYDNEILENKVNEDIDINSDKEVKLKAYQDMLQEYNTKKNNFKSILTTKGQDKWEEESARIIDGNSYLGTKWKLDKLEYNIQEDEEKLRGELTDEEKTEIQQTINDNRKKLKEELDDLNKKIKMDLEEIKKL